MPGGTRAWAKLKLKKAEKQTSQKTANWKSPVESGLQSASLTGGFPCKEGQAKQLSAGQESETTRMQAAVLAENLHSQSVEISDFKLKVADLAQELQEYMETAADLTAKNDNYQEYAENKLNEEKVKNTSYEMQIADLKADLAISRTTLPKELWAVKASYQDYD